MIALGTFQLAAEEVDLHPICVEALAARPSHTLANLLVHQLLTSLPSGPAKYGLLSSFRFPVRSDHSVYRMGPLNIVPPLPTGDGLSLVPFRWVATALTANIVFAIIAVAGLGDFVTALMTLSVDPHADWFVDTEDVAFHLIPGIGVHFEAIAFGEVPGAFAIYLGPRDSFSLKAS